MRYFYHSRATIVNFRDYVGISKHRYYVLLCVIAFVTKVPQHSASRKMLEQIVDNAVHKYSQEQIKTQRIDKVHKTR